MLMPHWPMPPWHKNIKYDLNNIIRLLEKLGSPHLKLPPVIHIAGTNGKGSSVALFKSIFEAAGLKAHAYTSPHLIEYNERIVLANEKISDNFLFEICEKTRLASLSIGLEPTFFEGATVVPTRVRAGAVPQSRTLPPLANGGPPCFRHSVGGA